jgi:putative peptidoglycan lipid II flippase
MRTSLAASLRGILLMAIPASVGLILLRGPLVAFLFERGKFDETDVQLTAWALLWYAAGLAGHSAMEILTRAFYAQHDTKTPVLIGTVAMGLNVVFSILLSGLFGSLGLLPHGGLALANSLATALEAAALFIGMRKRLGGMEGNHILRGIIPSGIAALVMGVVLHAWLYVGKNLGPWILAPVGVTVGGIAYLAALWALRVPELIFVAENLRKRLKR